MRVNEKCAKCLYDRQKSITDHAQCLAEIKEIIDNRSVEDTAPYLVYRFHEIREKYFGRQTPYGKIKKQYNELVLSMEDSVRKSIVESEDPLVKAFLYARAGNYIDFGAMDSVDENTFLSILDNAKMDEKERDVLQSFVEQCEKAKHFLLLADNCGEIALDKLFLEQLNKRFPELEITVMVRGEEVLNDATMEDALQVGIDKYATVISNGLPLAGTVYEMLPEDAKKTMDQADVILAKGQGNYESLCNQGRHIFYSFLCKCDLFTERFQVPQFTGVFTEEMK